MQKTTVIQESDIPEFRKNRQRTTFGSCYMTRGIFVSADGKLNCSCMIGYYSELGDLKNTHADEFCHGALVRYIAESFINGFEPFPMCRHCATRQKEKVPDLWYLDKCIVKGLTIHVEPSTHCNLFCEACLCTAERKADTTPPRKNMPYDLYEKMMHELNEGGIHVGNIVFAGFGEPLFNKNLPAMVRLARELYPQSHLSLDTNCNFPEEKAKEIADCGLDQIRLALDGADQDSYATYRVNGNFSMAIQFAKSLSAAVKDTGSKTQLIWKYILFKHNDDDALLAKAGNMAREYGLRIIYDVSVGPLASRRDHEDIKKSIKGMEISNNVNQQAYESFQSPLKDNKTL